jgi:hypothetical protein
MDKIMAVVIFRILLFLLPFIAFWFWVRYVKTHKTKDGKLDPKTQRQVQIGSIISIIAILGGMFYFGFTRPSNTDSDYAPPVVVDGKVKPGKLTPKDPAPKTDDES